MSDISHKPSTSLNPSVQQAFSQLPDLKDEQLSYESLTDIAIHRLKELNADLAEQSHLPSDPVRTVIEANTYQAWILLQRITRAQRALLVTTADGDDLDRLGNEYQLTRNTGENDDPYRLRIRERMTSSSVAGTKWHYRQRILDINPQLQQDYGFSDNAILNVHVGSSVGGQVDISLLINPKYRENQGAILDAAIRRAGADDVRAICDRVQVTPAKAKIVDIQARVIANHSDLRHINAYDYLNPCASDREDIQLRQSLDMRAAISAQLHAGFLDYELADLNQTLTVYKLERIMKVEGLYDLEFIQPQERIEAAPDEYLVLGDVQLEIVPRNRR